MKTLDALWLWAVLLGGGYVWVTYPKFVGSLLLTYVVIALITLTVAWVLRALGVVPSRAKRGSP